MNYFYLSNPFHPMPILVWVMQILVYAFVLAGSRLFLFQRVSQNCVPLFIYLIMGVLQIFIDDTAIINSVIQCTVAIGLIYFLANPNRQHTLTKITSEYLYVYTVNKIVAFLIGNVFMHVLHHYDPNMHSVIAQIIDPIEVATFWLITWLLLIAAQKISRNYFKVMVPYHYLWSWGIGLSVFPFYFFDYAILYRQVILPTALVVVIIICYAALLWFTMWITSKYYYYQAENSIFHNELANLQTYTSYIETLYDDVRRFRHDYKNILYTLSQSLNNHDIEGAQSLLTKMTGELDHSVAEQYSDISHLENILDPAVKSLIFYKMTDDLKDGLKVRVEAEQPIKLSNEIDSLDLVRLLAILLDNAANAAQQSTAKQVSISLFQKGNDHYLVVGNSTKEDAVNLVELEKASHQLQWSSRHGLGLKNVRAILNHYPAVQHLTSSQNHWFEQVIKIPVESEN